MPAPYAPPSLNEDAFNCPHCGAFAAQKESGIYLDIGRQGWTQVEGYAATFCGRCEEIALWVAEAMVYPEGTSAPSGHEDLPEGVRKDYAEAPSIVDRSPRGACGILRLAIQNLVNVIQPDGGDLNDRIGRLVAKGLDPIVQQSLDAVRVVGNNALHPGEMDLR